jgi:hypothetical protein
LAAIDTIYVTRRRISKIYLLDAVAEVALIAAWVIGAPIDRGAPGAPQSPRERGVGVADH